MNKRIVFRIVGIFLLMLALAELIPCILAFRMGDIRETFAFPYSIAAAIVVGLILLLTCRGGPSQLGPREGFGIVTFVWLSFAAFGALPFYFANVGLSYTDCFFETMSGFTTTGSSILSRTGALPDAIESLPPGLGFWRCMTHWIGGMGIIVLSLAILPFVELGGYQIFKAEVSGPVKSRISPRIQNTASVLWRVYLLLTIAGTLALLACGLSVYDALCHTFSTLGTGGFSTRNGSAGAFSPGAQWVMIALMVLGGTSFALHFFALRGRTLRGYFRNEEFRWYAGILLVATLCLFISLYGNSPIDSNGQPEIYTGVEKTVRTAVFQTASILTATGLATADFEHWSAFARMLLLALMLIGGCAGSTAGGIKISRFILLIKDGWREIMRFLQPRRVMVVKLDRIPVSNDTVSSVGAFFVLWLLIVGVASLVLVALLPLDGSADRGFLTAVSAVVTTMSNVGPGLGSIGPYGNFSALPDAAKWLLSGLMLLGRLEIYTALIIVVPSTWKK